MKKFILSMLIFLSGCSTISGMIPSFWDDNEAHAAINIRATVAQLNCKGEYAWQVVALGDDIEWLELYVDSKGSTDIANLIKPMKETTDAFKKRTQEKGTSEAYCNLKKRVLLQQSKAVAEAILSRVL